MTEIRFKMGELESLRKKLLRDSTKESFALLLGNTNVIDGHKIVTVKEVVFPKEEHYKDKTLTYLNISKDFFIDALKELDSRYDIDTIIDVHTHPFSNNSVAFSSIDDADEKSFFSFLYGNFDDLKYFSIVFSQKEYASREWIMTKSKKIKSVPTKLKTQLLDEMIPLSDSKKEPISVDFDMFNRGILALGLDTLNKITSNQIITVVGAGGTGSVILESLVHMGFTHINIIDNDVLEISNMNRIVGAYYTDAVSNGYKVDVIGEHLLKINPKLTLNVYRNNVLEKDVEKVLALSNWIIAATDNHSSRFKIQEIAFQYYVPFISVGVNIAVENDKIVDESGEVITIRMGDRVCLECLKRLNHIKAAYETNSEGDRVSSALINKGYVKGKDIKEPAVKTLNSIVGQMVVDILINQYTNQRRHQTICVYERNEFPVIYEDSESIKERNKQCHVCSI